MHTHTTYIFLFHYILPLSLKYSSSAGNLELEEKFKEISAAYAVLSGVYVCVCDTHTHTRTHAHTHTHTHTHTAAYAVLSGGSP